MSRRAVNRAVLVGSHRLDVRTWAVRERHHRRELAELEPPR
ncbi:hypothetical protein ACFYS8_28315 [Kitasatospora sp. NPDC004615]